MKRRNLCLAIGAVVLLGAAAGCDQVTDLLSDEITYQKTLAYQATNSLTLLNTIEESKVANLSTIENSDKDTIESLLNQFDLLLTNDNLVVKVDEVSDRVEYKVMQTITYKSIEGEDKSFVLYYNETPLVEEEDDIDDDDDIDEIDDKDTDDLDDDNDDDDDDRKNRKEKDGSNSSTSSNQVDSTSNQHKHLHNEVEVSLEGIALVNEKEYRFTGLKELEVFNNKSEEEVTFTIYTNDKSYVRVEQEKEVKLNKTEEEYNYLVVENGKTIYEYGLSKIIKNNQTEIEIELGEDEYSIVKKEIDGHTYYDVYVEIESEQGDREYAVRYEKVSETDANDITTTSFVEITK